MTNLANSSTSRPRLALTLGDPAGIGPEVVLKALADAELRSQYEITIIGSRHALQMTAATLSSNQSKALGLDHSDWQLLEVPVLHDQDGEIQLGHESAASGAASFAYLETAIAQTLAGQFEGIVTGPIAKSAWKAAGHLYPGQTELLAEKAGVSRFGMLFVAESPQTSWPLCVLLATTHIPLRQVPEALTPELMTRKLALLVEFLQQDLGKEFPKVAIAGLNPHSGEQGQLGREEQDWLVPWLATMRSQFPQITLDGPVPPDTLWIKPGLAWSGAIPPGAAHDGYLALYHDQGLIPIKLLAFDRAVNTTIGLPFIRTSPDHGTAFDIAGQGLAQAESLKAAIRLAGRLVQQRRSRGIRVNLP